MAINFACKQCGKRMQAKEDFGGRRLRCPCCGTVLTIPTPPRPAKPSTPPPPPPRPEPARTEPRPRILTPAPIPAASPAPARRVASAQPPPEPAPEPLTLGVAEIGEEKNGFDDDPAVRTPWPRRGPAATLPRTTNEENNVWVDHSLFLDQISTPWSEEDLKRWGINPSEPSQGGSAGLVLVVLVVVVLLLLGGAGVVAGWAFWPQIAALFQ